MASYAKSVGLLVIIVAVLCSPASGSFFTGLLRGFKGGSKINPKVPKPPVFPYNQFAKSVAKKKGESLAHKYFGLGNQFIKGFRWGYKAGKRILSVERKCEDFTQVLEASSCPQPRLSNLLPNSPVFCIVEILVMNGTCLQPHEWITYPQEAICSLEQPDTLNSLECGL